jgi:hypothetical protein
MPWHLSQSDARKVYDSYHNPVCVCQTQDQAALIVKAVNLIPQLASIKLREPGVPAEKESADQNQSRAASGNPETGKPLDTLEPDEYCAKHLLKALRSGYLNRQSLWECPKCGCNWVAKDSGPLRHWEPVTAIAIFR